MELYKWSAQATGL
ncbi:unnamed protein product, partial [Rotaria sp. Silwood1]